MVVPAAAQGLEVVDLERLVGGGGERGRAAVDAEPSALALVDQGQDLRRVVAQREAARVPAAPVEEGHELCPAHMATPEPSPRHPHSKVHAPLIPDGGGAGLKVPSSFRASGAPSEPRR